MEGRGGDDLRGATRHPPLYKRRGHGKTKSEALQMGFEEPSGSVAEGSDAVRRPDRPAFSSGTASHAPVGADDGPSGAVCRQVLSPEDGGCVPGHVRIREEHVRFGLSLIVI